MHGCSGGDVGALGRVRVDKPTQEGSATPGKEERKTTDKEGSIAAIERMGGRFIENGGPGGQILNLSNTEITDAGLVHLEGLNKLGSLDLSENQITDARLTYLKEMAALDRLWLGETEVTDAGVAKLKAALPKCEVFR